MSSFVWRALRRNGSIYSVSGLGVIHQIVNVASFKAACSVCLSSFEWNKIVTAKGGRPICFILLIHVRRTRKAWEWVLPRRYLDTANNQVVSIGRKPIRTLFIFRNWVLLLAGILKLVDWLVLPSCLSTAVPLVYQWSHSTPYLLFQRLSSILPITPSCFFLLIHHYYRWSFYRSQY